MKKFNNVKKVCMALGLGIGLSFSASSASFQCQIACINAEAACEVFPGGSDCRYYANLCRNCNG